MTYRSLMASLMAVGLLSAPAMAAGDGASAQAGQDQQMQQAAGTSGGMGQSASAVTQDPEKVRQIQQALSDQGYDIQVDGIWGENTQQALMEFQQQQGIQAEDPASPETLAALGVEEEGQMGGQSPQTATVPGATGGQAEGGGQQQPAPPAQ